MGYREMRKLACMVAINIYDWDKQDIENMDPETREVLDKVLGYVEKKYISGPMKLAKEIILKKNT